MRNELVNGICTNLLLLATAKWKKLFCANYYYDKLLRTIYHEIIIHYASRTPYGHCKIVFYLKTLCRVISKRIKEKNSFNKNSQYHMVKEFYFGYLPADDPEDFLQYVKWIRSFHLAVKLIKILLTAHKRVAPKVLGQCILEAACAEFLCCLSTLKKKAIWEIQSISKWSKSHLFFYINKQNLFLVFCVH